MATYCIGDIQGCYAELQQLLQVINYHESDHLWFVGDLVNRGPQSLEVLRLIKKLPNTKIVLGNHDLHLLTFFHKIVDFEVKYLEPILIAPDGGELVEWLRKQPLLYHDPRYNCVLVHAGIYPTWDLAQAVIYAREVAEVLQGQNYLTFLKNLYGDEPSHWDDNLTGWERLRFIVNAFTRMRFCSFQGDLEFKRTGGMSTAPQGYIPWFQIPWRRTKQVQIIFGHWAALKGKTDTKNIIALDTGCVWGEQLTALRLEDRRKFQVQAL